MPLKDVTNLPMTAKHFADPVTSPELEKAAKGVILTNTESSMQWAIRTFNAQLL